MASYYTKICSILMIMVMMYESKTNALSIPEETSIRVYYRDEDQINIYFYRFNTTSGVKFSYDIEYREKGQTEWNLENSLSHFASSIYPSTVYSEGIYGLKFDTIYQIKVSYYSEDPRVYIGESTVLEERTYPVSGRRRGNRAFFFSHENKDLDEQKKTFSEALAYCKSLSAELASIVSQDETLFANNAMGNSRGSFWIGLEMTNERVLHCNTCNLCYIGANTETNCQLCESCRNKWTWQDGSQMTWQNWEVQQPNENKECGVLNVNGKWYDSDCNNRNYFICSKEFRCSKLDYPEHGSVSVSYNSYGAKATYTCQIGYRLVGSSARYCFINLSHIGIHGIWSGDAAICEYDGGNWNDSEPTAASVHEDKLCNAESGGKNGWTTTLAVVASIVVLTCIITIIVVIYTYRSLMKAIIQSQQTQGPPPQKSPGNQYENSSFHNITEERAKPTAPPSNDQLKKLEGKRTSTSGGNVNSMVRYYANKESDEQEHYESIKPS